MAKLAIINDAGNQVLASGVSISPANLVRIQNAIAAQSENMLPGEVNSGRIVNFLQGVLRHVEKGFRKRTALDTVTDEGDIFV